MSELAMNRRKDHKRLLTEDEFRDIRYRENREGSPYSDRDMLLDHLELLGRADWDYLGNGEWRVRGLYPR